MKNFDRYKGYSQSKYNRKGLSYYLMRKPADHILLSYLEKIKKKKILEVGIGYGYYTKVLIKNKNKVTGADVNPELGKSIGIDIIETAANKLDVNIKEKYDLILSFFMTEYLSKLELEAFIRQSLNLLNVNGVFSTTIILNKGIGKFYTSMAQIKGIKKYAYSYKDIMDLANISGNKIRIVPLNSIFKIPFAVFLEIKRG